MKMRFLWRSIPAWCAVLLVAPAAAAPAEPAPPLLTITGEPGRRVVVDTPRDASIAPAAPVSRTIYLDRCAGGCALHMGASDAHASTTTLLLIPNATITEFASSTGAIGAGADPEWDMIVQCLQEVYSPYDVVVTDVKPGADASYQRAIIAGHPGEVGRASDILGVAPLANDCSAIDNTISLSFANQHTSPTAFGRARNICWTASQESAHVYGLDHEYSFVAGNRSACSDAMTYRTDCGGQKFFRNEAAHCGETNVRACRCGASQNSHRKLLSVFGPGTPTTGNPTMTLLAPTGSTLGEVVIAEAGATRGVARVGLYLNGYKWTELPGARILADGQPDPSTYMIPVPDGVPNSIIDVQTIAFDDLNASAESTVVTVTKGAPCTTAERCAIGQKCEAGRCFWDPPAGELDERCTYSQFCKSARCEGPAGAQVCTQACLVDVDDACPADFTCVTATATATSGVCVLASSGGCCSVDRRGDGGWAHLGIGAAALAFAIRKRRR